MPISFTCVKLSFVGPSNSTTPEEPDNCSGEDGTFDVFTVREAIHCANQKLPYANSLNSRFNILTCNITLHPAKQGFYKLHFNNYY